MWFYISGVLVMFILVRLWNGWISDEIGAGEFKLAMPWSAILVLCSWCGLVVPVAILFSLAWFALFDYLMSLTDRIFKKKGFTDNKNDGGFR